MEGQEGKERIRKKDFSNLGEKAVCIVRGVKATREFKNLTVDNFSIYEPKRRFYGDSWFGSVKVISNIAKTGHHAVMIIKPAHS